MSENDSWRRLYPFESHYLDLDSVRRAFAARVMGQPEAVDCLVERIAMLKAGLCDPRRPVGRHDDGLFAA